MHAQVFRVIGFGVLGLAALPAFALPVSGTANYDRRTGALSYDLEFGRAQVRYVLEGTTVSDPDFSLLRDLKSDFSGIEVEKVDRRGGYRTETLENRGVLHVEVRQREAFDVVFAGIPIAGRYVSSLINSNRFDGLVVGGVGSRGGLDYNLFNGQDRVLPSTQFGAHALGALKGAQGVALDWDNFLGQDRVKVRLQFGDLAITGDIQHSQNGETVVVSHFALEIKKLDGSEVELAAIGQPLSEEEKQLRAFIAFLQIFGSDLAS